VLSSITIYWHLIFGILLILVVLFAPGGISGQIKRWEAK
jgi:branched-chain amino acid transport system permease protein